METEEILKGLNKEQKEAVLHVDGPLLVIAGAGAGTGCGESRGRESL